MKKQWMKIIGICFTVSLVVGMIGGVLTNEYFVGYIFGQFIEEQEENLPIVKKVIEKQTYIEESKILDAVEQVNLSVVSLFVTESDADSSINRNMKPNDLFVSKTSDSFYLNTKAPLAYPQGTIGGGTGYFISTDGLIATCSSLINGYQIIYIPYEDTIYTANIVYQDPNDDFVLLKLNIEDDYSYFKTVTFAENQPESGQKVIALGKNVFGDNYVKSGIVSNIGIQETTEEVFSSLRLFPWEFITIDFEIDSSLHCSPVVNLGGEVVGMALDFDSVEEGTSYVIPANEIQEKFYNYQEISD